jgi:hypothetical protein
MQAGRNYPCPCGSGKKYKKCCLLAEPAVDPVSNLRTLQDSVEGRLIRFVGEQFGEETLQLAWDEFSDGSGAFDPDSPEVQLFFPWFFYDWRADGGGPGRRQREAIGRTTMAQVFLKSQDLDEPERAFIEAVVKEPLSFFEVVHAEPGKGLWLKDILRGVEYDVAERTASRSLERGDIVFGRVVPFPTCALLAGLGSTSLPPIEKGSVLELRKSLRTAAGEISAGLLRGLCPEVLRLYRTIRERLLNPPRPELHNTDGEPFLMHTLTYRVESTEDALQALHSLHVGSSVEELRQSAQLRSDGTLRKVAFPWTKKGNKLHKHWDNTILGHLEIAGGTLTVTVNSAKRAKAIQSEIQKRLGPRATHLKTETQSPETLLAQTSRDDAAAQESRRQSEEFNARPEIQAIMKKAIYDHWQAWLDQKIPALGDKTPRVAVRDPEGREMVEALLLDAERSERTMGRDAYDFDRVREHLGLKPSSRRDPST